MQALTWLNETESIYDSGSSVDCLDHHDQLFVSTNFEDDTANATAALFTNTSLLVKKRSAKTLFFKHKKELIKYRVLLIVPNLESALNEEVGILLQLGYENYNLKNSN
ncbi:hypothetical protein BpHYR1_042436 [Brachionus plicatilis]|uniref:Uncharacterized protein n=1 Tax=Brachionus plicatilis TaxID=10195 RepID=A0A3M7QXE2_BRAPC|nr:hypothetical protein BpHYR1_042436 [Brachionus plicatilis]